MTKEKKSSNLLKQFYPINIEDLENISEEDYIKAMLDYQALLFMELDKSKSRFEILLKKISELGLTEFINKEKKEAYSDTDYWFQQMLLTQSKKLIEYKNLEDIKYFTSKLNDVKENIQRLNEKIDALTSENERLKLFAYNQIISADIEKKIQYIPVDIYIDNDSLDAILDLYDLMNEFLKTIDFEREIELQAIKGSWFKRTVAKSKKAITSEEVIDRLKEAEYGIEVNTVLKQQSEIDLNSSQALANIIKSLDNTANAAIRIGSLLVVKVTNENGEVNLQVRTLTIKELHLLNKNPELLSKPQDILKAISKAIDDNDKALE